MTDNDKLRNHDRIEFTLTGKAVTGLLILFTAGGGVSGFLSSRIPADEECHDCRRYSYECETRNHNWEQWYTAHGSKALAAVKELERLEALRSLPRYYSKAR